MTFKLSEFKKYCKENGFALKTKLFGIGKNDSGKCDMYVETGDTLYSVKLLTAGEDSERVYFKTVGGYITVKGKKGSSDYLWVAPDFKRDTDKKNVAVLLIDSDIPATVTAKNSAMVVTPGATVFGCSVHTPTSFMKMLANG